MRDFGGGSPLRGGGVQVRLVSVLRVDVQKLGALIGKWAAKRIRQRTRKGISSTGVAFAIGADGQRVDLDRNGTLLESLHVSAVRVRADGVDVYVDVRPDLQRIAVFLHFGTERMPARPWLALSPADFRDLSTYLERKKVLREVAA